MLLTFVYTQKKNIGFDIGFEHCFTLIHDAMILLLQFADIYNGHTEVAEKKKRQVGPKEKGFFCDMLGRGECHIR